MNPRRVDEYNYIQFLLAAQRLFSTEEAIKVVSEEERAPTHNAYTRLLQCLPPDSQ
jgi:putative transposase